MDILGNIASSILTGAVNPGNGGDTGTSEQKVDLGNIASSILTGAVNAGNNSNATPEQKVDLTKVAQAVQGIKLPDAQTLAQLKQGLEGLSKENGLPANVQGTLKLLLQNFGTLDTASQESRQGVWEKLKPLIGDANKLSATVSLFGSYGGKLIDILKATFLH